MANKKHTVRNILVGVGIGLAAAYFSKKENREQFIQASKDTLDSILDTVEEVRNDPEIVKEHVAHRVDQIQDLIESISEDIEQFSRKIN